MSNPEPYKRWHVTVTTPNGKTDEGGITIVGAVVMPPRKIADGLSNIVYRLAHDLADAEADELRHESGNGHE